MNVMYESKKKELRGLKSKMLRLSPDSYEYRCAADKIQYLVFDLFALRRQEAEEGATVE